MHNISCRLLIVTMAAWLLAAGALSAEPLVREIFVPFDDLNVLLEGDAQRVFMSRDQYEALLAKARSTPEEKAPHQVALLSGRYEGTIEEGRARLTGELTIDVLADGLHALPLQLSGVALHRATLDDRPASLGRDANKPVLFVEGVGQHTLTLEMFVPLETAAALQTLSFQVPTPPAAQLHLTVQGNVEVKSGAEVVERVVDQQQSATRLSLVLRPGPVSLVMTLNNRLLRASQVVVARSVLVDEVTAAYERLHASVSLGILHGAVDRFRFVVPAGFEVTEVATPLLSQWKVTADDEGRNILEARLSEPATDTVVLNITAIATPARLDEWTWPRLEMLDAAGQMAIVGLLLEEQLKAQRIEHEQLIPIDNAVLAAALPASVFAAEQGAPRVRPIVTYYAPQNEFELRAQFTRPPTRLNVTTNLLLTLNDKQHHVRGSFALLPDSDEQFSVSIDTPPDWHVTEVTDASGQPLSFERYDDGEQPRVVVRFDQGIPPGQTYNVFFQAVHAPVDWLSAWTARETEFPHFAVRDAARDEGAIAIRALDDLRVRPETLEQLTPLDEDDKGKYGLGGVPTDLAYRYETSDYQALLAVERAAPRITARTYSFLQINSGGLHGHFEIVYDIAEARTGALSFRLPASTPAALSIHGLDGVVVSQTESEELGDERRWTAHLAERRQGRVRLGVDFQQRLTIVDRASAGLSQEISLPLPAADGVAYQTGLVAVEGSADLAVDITRHPRRVDVGELVDAQYQPGRRLLGSFGYVGPPAEVSVDVTRQPPHLLPGAIVERAELVTLVSASGMTQSAARFQLRTKLPFLEIELPPGAKLWSTRLDGQPGQPQQHGGRLLVSLPPAAEHVLRDLQIVYDTQLDPLSLWGTVDLPAPRLFLRETADTPAQEVPMADLKWHLHLPAGYRVSKTDGTVFTDQVEPPETPLAMAAAALGIFAADFYPHIQVAREAGRAASADAVTNAAPEEAHRAATVQTPATADEAAAEQPTTEPADPQAAPQAQPQAPADKPAEMPPPQATPPAEKAEQTSNLDKQQSARRAAGAKSKLWALEGVRSLKIDLQRLGDRVSFESLGVDPRIEATLAHRHRLAMLAWGLALLVALLGLALTSSRLRTKVRFVAAVLIVSSLLPLLGDWFAELTPACELVFLTGCALIVYYLAAAVVRWVARRLSGWPLERRAAANVAGVLLVALATSSAHAQPAKSARAQPEQAPRTSDMLLADLERLLLPTRPVELPENAVIVPYDATKPLGEDQANKLLVPYDTYVELWNRAHPDRKILDRPPPAPYAVAGTRYEATLEEEDSLLLTGRLDIDIFADGAVTIPLQLEGGVLTSATLDGKPALLRATSEAAPAAAMRAAATPASSTLSLYAEGKGRKRLEVTVRLKLERRGGWRVAVGRVPAGLATELVLHVPQAGTEVRLNKLADRGGYETDKNGETVETALGNNGALNLQWRAKVAQAQVDRSLTADSSAVLDVREDGLRLHWQLKLEFRGSTRDAFTLEAPSDYLVEKLSGTNVRGWESKPLGERQQIEVTLLKAVADREEISLELSRRGRLGQGEVEEFTAPSVTVASAVLHHGRLVVRRSPLLELRTVEVSGLSRADAPMGDLAAIASYDESPLGQRLYQTFQFVHTPFTLRLSAQAIEASATAQVQSLLRVSEREPTLESHVRLRVSGRPLYRVRIGLPAGFQLDRVVAPGVHQWAVAEEDARQVLSVYLASGQSSEFSIVVAGRLPAVDENQTLPLPNLAVLDVSDQQGQIVVQADPAYDVRVSDRQNVESALLATTFGWLQQPQRAAARIALAYRSGDYGGTLTIVPRKPQVRVLSISNTKVTDRTIEETILLEFTIREAGIREVAFVLPQTLQQARIRAPLLRQKTIEPLAGADDSQVRVRLEFQDEIMGQLRVLVQNDRLLTGQQQSAPIPAVETGVTTDRYVTLESAGNDEVVIDQSPGLDPLSRQQSEWRTLTGLLGTGLTQAFLVRDSAAAPRLIYQTKKRAAVETVGARIGLAETLLLVDPYGAYRGAVDYHVENTTEQFLDVRLPEGAELWTVRVASEAVKPVERSGAAPQVVSIPLIKTAVGDKDYRVTLKYGGRLPRLAVWRRIEFPLVRTVNINVELSQVRLRLPETHHWLDFDGTMRRVADEAELTAGFLSYRNRQIERLSQILSSASSYSKARATSNLKQLQIELETLQSQKSAANGKLRSYYDANTAALAESERIAAEQQQAAEAPSFDNRFRLNDLYGRQQNTRSKNVVTELKYNFEQVGGNMAAGDRPHDFEQEWLMKNQLDAAKKPASPSGSGRVSGLQQGQQSKPGEQSPTTVNQPQAAGVAQGQAKQRLQREAGQQQQRKGGAQREDDSRSQLRRYQQRLEDQLPGQPAQKTVPAMPGRAGGQRPDTDGDDPFGAFGKDPSSGAPYGAPGPQGGYGQPAPNPAAPSVALASLDVELPPLGPGYREVLFTTPRGEVEITSRPLSDEVSHRLTRLAAVLGVVLLAWIASRGARSYGSQLLASRLLAVGLMLAGLVGLLTCLLPLLGLASLLVGAALLVWQRLVARPPATA